MGRKNKITKIDEGSRIDRVWDRLYRIEDKLSKLIGYLVSLEEDKCKKQILELIENKFY